MSKKINLRKIRPTHTYKVSELAFVLGLSRQAIYKKINQENGLPIIPPPSDDAVDEYENGVWLIYGQEFIDFEKAERLRRKPPKQPNKFWCFNCRSYHKPVKNKVEIDDFSQRKKKAMEGTILLVGKCSNCKNDFYQLSNISQLKKIKKRFVV